MPELHESVGKGLTFYCAGLTAIKVLINLAITIIIICITIITIHIIIIYYYSLGDIVLSSVL